MRPAHRRKGIGRALFVHLARRCVAEGWTRFEWAVLDWNAPSIAFYRAMGATLLDDWTICRLSGPGTGADRGRGGRLMRLVLLAAVADNGVIGQAGGMPWRLKSDLAHFRAASMGKPVVMGRKTYASIGKPLAGRTNIVVSRDRTLTIPGALVTTGLAQALAAARGDALRRSAGEIVIIGGADIYAQTSCDRRSAGRDPHPRAPRRATHSFRTSTRQSGSEISREAGAGRNRASLPSRSR